MTGTSTYRIFYMLLLIPLALLSSLVWIIFVTNNDENIFKASNEVDGCTEPCIPGNESIMKQKTHGTSNTSGVQNNLKWNCDIKIADRICNYNRQYAEYSGYWEYSTTFLNDIHSINNISEDNPIIFYDSNTGKELFRTPIGRTWDDFIDESEHHGWPSFRDQEVNWDNVRVLKNGETVSIDGTHLGHNLPDNYGRRYCINLVSIAGNPIVDDTNTTTSNEIVTYTSTDDDEDETIEEDSNRYNKDLL